jgi:hypothetical protein
MKAWKQMETQNTREFQELSVKLTGNDLAHLHHLLGENLVQLEEMLTLFLLGADLTGRKGDVLVIEMSINKLHECFGELTFPDIVGVVSVSIFLIASTFSCLRFFSSGDSSGACSGMYRSGIRILLGAPNKLSIVFSEIFSRGPRAERTTSGALILGRRATSMSRSSRARQLTFYG